MMTSDALGPSVWAASDGRAGNRAQALAVARALGEMTRWVKIAHINGKGHRAEPIDLKINGIQPMLPSRMWWSPLSTLPKSQKQIFQPPWPTVWIAAGRRTSAFSRHIRKASDGETLTVHIMKPDLELSAFDLVAAPEHDKLEGENVISTLGSASYFAPEAIEDAELAFGDMAEERGFKVAVNLGGDSKTHKMTEAVAQKLERQLDNLATQGARLRITCSRRTPTHARVRFRNFSERVGAKFWEGPADGQNPYLANLLMSDAAIVTEDSTNMLSEAAYFGLPLHIVRMEGEHRKFDSFYKSLIDHGIARWFEGEIFSWTYQPLREIDKIADAIVKKLIERHPPPEFATAHGARLGDRDRR